MPRRKLEFRRPALSWSDLLDKLEALKRARRRLANATSKTKLLRGLGEKANRRFEKEQGSGRFKEAYTAERVSTIPEQAKINRIYEALHRAQSECQVAWDNLQVPLDKLRSDATKAHFEAIDRLSRGLVGTQISTIDRAIGLIEAVYSAVEADPKLSVSGVQPSGKEHKSESDKDELSERRRSWVESHKERTGASLKEIHAGAKVDASEYHKWRRGELSESSETSQRIERFLREPPDAEKTQRGSGNSNP